MFTFVDGMLSGSKAPILGIIMLFAVSFFFVFYAKRGNFNLSRKFFVRGLVVLVVLASLFRGLSMVIGRNVSERSNWDLLAEYCGAEIKISTCIYSRILKGEILLYGGKIHFILFIQKSIQILKEKMENFSM